MSFPTFPTDGVIFLLTDYKHIFAPDPRDGQTPGFTCAPVKGELNTRDETQEYTGARRARGHKGHLCPPSLSCQTRRSQVHERDKSRGTRAPKRRAECSQACVAAIK